MGERRGVTRTSSVWGWGQKLKREGTREREREKKTLAVIHEALSTLQVPTKAFTEIKHGTILDMRRDDQSVCVSKCVSLGVYHSKTSPLPDRDSK